MTLTRNIYSQGGALLWRLEVFTTGNFEDCAHLCLSKFIPLELNDIILPKPFMMHLFGEFVETPHVGLEANFLIDLPWHVISPSNA